MSIILSKLILINVQNEEYLTSNFRIEVKLVRFEGCKVLGPFESCPSGVWYSHARPIWHPSSSWRSSSQFLTRCRNQLATLHGWRSLRRISLQFHPYRNTKLGPLHQQQLRQGHSRGLQRERLGRWEWYRWIHSALQFHFQWPSIYLPYPDKDMKLRYPSHVFWHKRRHCPSILHCNLRCLLF